MILAAALGWLYGQFAAFFRDWLKIYAELLDNPPDLDNDLDEALAPPGPAPPAARPLSSGQITAKVQAYAREHDDFSVMWTSAVQAAADSVAAEIAGARMAGATRGMITWDAKNIPTPEILGQGLVRQAFCLAVYAEVSRRLRAMRSPGAFG